MKYVLYGHGGSYNHGAEAILKTTISRIKNNIADEVFLSTHFVNQDKEFGIPVNEFLTRKKGFSTREEEQSKQFILDAYSETINKVDSTTTALSVGGDNYCYPAWHRWSCLHNEIKKKGARDILWSCSINPESITDLMLETLASHDLITARETITYHALLGKGLKNVKRCADVAFLLEPEKVLYPQGFLEGNTIAINISPLIIRKELRTGIVNENIIHLIEYILDNSFLHIMLIPHVLMEVDNDYTELKRIYEDIQKRFKNKSERICLCPSNLSAAQYKFLISKCRFGLFSRTHATIAAYSSGVPCIAIGYSIKSIGIALDFNMNEYVIPIENIENTTSLVNAFSNMEKNEQHIKENLMQNIDIEKERAKQNFAYLREII